MARPFYIGVCIWPWTLYFLKALNWIVSYGQLIYQYFFLLQKYLWNEYLKFDVIGYFTISFRHQVTDLTTHWVTMFLTNSSSFFFPRLWLFELLCTRRLCWALSVSYLFFWVVARLDYVPVFEVVINGFTIVCLVQYLYFSHCFQYCWTAILWLILRFFVLHFECILYACFYT